jgi:hypothetical protein
MLNGMSIYKIEMKIYFFISKCYTVLPLPIYRLTPLSLGIYKNQKYFQLLTVEDNMGSESIL